MKPAWQGERNQRRRKRAVSASRNSIEIRRSCRVPFTLSHLCRAGIRVPRGGLVACHVSEERGAGSEERGVPGPADGGVRRTGTGAGVRGIKSWKHFALTGHAAISCHRLSSERFRKGVNDEAGISLTPILVLPLANALRGIAGSTVSGEQQRERERGTMGARASAGNGELGAGDVRRSTSSTTSGQVLKD